MPVSILHISDLHRDAGSQVTTASLLESLRLDRDRYLSSGSSRRPDVAIVSGDIVHGVSPGAPDSDRLLRSQYDEASAFLGALADEFFDSDRERVVLIPGNHDVSFPHVERATRSESIPTTETARALLLQQLAQENSDWRWSWNEFALRRVVDRDTYNQRLEAFADFYGAFYGGRRTYSLEPHRQFAVHEFPRFDLVVAALSSCCDNDPFNRTGRIHPDCVAGATKGVAARVRQGWAAVAVWHHSLAGGPKETDYVDADVLQSLMDGGFVLGLHGHQHRPQLLEHRFTADRKRSIVVASAGTLCGGPRTLPVGRMRAYNLIAIDIPGKSGVLHVREMRNVSFGTPVWAEAHVPEFAGSSMEFALSIGPAEGKVIQIAAEAAERLRVGHANEAYAMVRPHLADGLARRVAVEALTELDEWAEIRTVCSPPQSPAEFVALCDALYQLGEHTELHDVLDAGVRQFPDNQGVVQCIEQMRIRLRGR